MKVWLTIGLVTAFAWADGVKVELELAYARAERAARFKYVEGLLSNRAAGFQLYGPEGDRRDLTLERQRFESLFSNALRVRFRTRLVRVAAIKNGAQAEVDQALQLEQVDAASGRRYTVILNTRAIDHWRRTPLGWKLAATRVLRQTLSTSGALAK